ncbi:MAG: sensor histidine kinase [Chitinophagaceae bacterium]
MSSDIHSEAQIQKMLSIINQIPVGLVECNRQGEIVQMNAKSVQLLMPFFYQLQINTTQFFSLLQAACLPLYNLLFSFSNKTGIITNQQRFVFGINPLRHYLFTVNAIDEQSFVFMFDDITDLYEKETALNQIAQEKAIEQNKFEIASGVLHDIGNAVISFGSYITKLKRFAEQTDTATLKNLLLFFEKNKTVLVESLGEAKTNAIIQLLQGLIENNIQFKANLNTVLGEQQNTVSHINDILSIQRQYVKGQSANRLPLNIRTVINDAVAMLANVLHNRNIDLQIQSPAQLPLIKGDRTKLMQVFLNLFKNSADSLLEVQNPHKSIIATITCNNPNILISIADKGIGFEPEKGAKLFEKGFTTKTQGSGFGLYNCKSIIESHNATINIVSEGLQKGALVTIEFIINNNKV